MMLILLSLAVGVATGAFAGWQMRHQVRMPLVDVVTGALGAMAGVAAPFLLEPATADSLVTRLTLATLGALILTIVAHVAVQARRPMWGLAPASGSASHAARRAHATASDRMSTQHAASVASVASREQPLLVLHGGHALRCWPSEARVPMLHSTERLDWTVEIDGQTECQGPSGDARSTPRELAATVRQWWDDRQDAREVARG